MKRIIAALLAMWASATAHAQLIQNSQLATPPSEINVKSAGIVPGTQDNSPLLPALMNEIGPPNLGSGYDVVFPGISGQRAVGYYFADGVYLTRNANYHCSGTENANGVELVIPAGQHGVVQETNAYSTDFGVAQGSVNGCLIQSMGMGSVFAGPSSSTLTNLFMHVDLAGLFPASTWNVGDGIAASPCAGAVAPAGTVPAVNPGAYISNVSGTTLTLAPGYTTSANLSGSTCLQIYQLPVALKYTVQTTSGSNSVLVTNGPRLLVPGEVVWSDAFPLGTMIVTVSGTLGSQTVTMTDSFDTANPTNATVTHTSGSPGQMWILPAGIKRDIGANSSDNNIIGFPIGLEMACSSASSMNCTGSHDARNDYRFALVGRWTAGNNTSASSSIDDTTGGNVITDYYNGGTLGETDTNFNANSNEDGSAMYGPMGECGSDNLSVMLGGYLTTATGGCAVQNGMVPPTNGAPWIFIGTQDETPQGSSTLLGHNFYNAWNFINGDAGPSETCLNGGVAYTLSFDWGDGCGEPGSWYLRFNPAAGQFFWSLDLLNAGGQTMWLTQGAQYGGYTDGDLGFVAFQQGFLLYDTEAGNLTPGPERLVDEGLSIPVGTFHKTGDIHFNQNAVPGTYAGWINTASGAHFVPFGLITGSVAIASLPTCNSTNVATQSWINNGITAPTYHQAVSSTGTATWPVFCTYNGSSYSWVY